jgi:hypothetical protein
VPSGSVPSSSVPSSSVPSGGSTAPQTVVTVGGSVTVRSDNGVITIVSVSPAPGFAVNEQSSAGTQAEVDFRSDTHRSKLTFRLSGGVITASVDERDA